LLEVVRAGSDIPTRAFSAIALLAIANGALLNMIMASRLLYGMAQEGVMPPAFGRVHRTRQTPWIAIVFATAISMLLIAVGRLAELATVTVMLLLIVFALVNVAVLVLRRDDVGHAHFAVPRIFPVLGILISAVLFVKRATDEDHIVLLILLALLGVGLLLWLAGEALSSRRRLPFSPAGRSPTDE
jgi:amino acid transporter